jgi:hypothetical protein
MNLITRRAFSVFLLAAIFRTRFWPVAKAYPITGEERGNNAKGDNHSRSYHSSDVNRNSEKGDNHNSNVTRGDSLTATGRIREDDGTEFDRSVRRQSGTDIDRATTSRSELVDSNEVRDLREVKTRLSETLESLEDILESPEKMLKVSEAPTRWHLLQATTSASGIAGDVKSATEATPSLLDRISAGWATLGTGEKIIVGAGGIFVVSIHTLAVGVILEGATVAEIAGYGAGLAKGALALRLATSIGVNSALEAAQIGVPTTLSQSVSLPVQSLGAGVKDTALGVVLNGFDKIDKIASTPAY